jgi:hypothetical protein
MITKKIFLLSAFCLLVISGAFAQGQFGEIRGKVVDDKTNKPLDYATVVAEFEGSYKASVLTNDNGDFFIKPLNPGKYSLLVSIVGYQSVRLDGVIVNSDQITPVTVKLTSGVQLKDIIKYEYKKPFIEPDGTAKKVLSVDHAPSRNVNVLAGQVAGVVSLGGGTPNFRGARAEGTQYLYNGIVFYGRPPIPQDAIDQVEVITGGIPAQYGDLTGGAISIKTRAPSKRKYKSFNLLSSSMFDKYHYNHFESVLIGPLKVKNEGEGDKERTVLAYLLTGNMIYAQDGSPSANGMWKIRDEKLKEIEARPLAVAPRGVGLVGSGELITQNDLEKVKAKQNVGGYSATIAGELNYQPTDNINIATGGTYSYNSGRNFSFANSLFNPNNNSISTAGVGVGYVKFTQTFNKNAEKDDEKKPLITNAFYTVRLDYFRLDARSEDAVHKDRFFDYGYVGKFKTYSAPFYTRQGDQANSEPKLFLYDTNGDGVKDSVYLRDYFELQETSFDTLTTFERSEKNPIRANYTQQYYEFAGEENVSNVNQIRQGLGLLNGDNPVNIYGLFGNVGNAQAIYSKSNQEKYTLFIMGEASVNSKKNSSKKHDLQFGMHYEQRVTRGYSLNTIGLWTLMRQLTNQHLTQLDKENPILVYDENGVFQDTVRYNRAIKSGEQSDFDRNFRASLIANGQTDVRGNPVTETTLIDVNAYSPDQFDVKMFSADDLLSNGSSYVNYFGYDHLGNKVKGKHSINEFLANEKRTIGAFMPIYSALFIQDKFAFKDLVLRVGLRIDRYDANQLVLKDPYSLYPVKTAGEVTTLGGNNVSHPSSIGEDFAVYVNDVDNPTNVVGYRSMDEDVVTWYNKEGTVVSDPAVLAQATSKGRISPYLVDPKNQQLTNQSFVDYTPQVNFMPRVWFSFPISTTAQFFATYDVLTQRPPEGSVATIDDYYYLQVRALGIINNPNLKPIRKTDYELGFRQKLTNNSGLGLVASYSEMRDLIQQFRVYQAYPISYTTYANIDFGTVKGFRVEYELRDMGNLSLTANYTLQFADGTGSNSASSQALIAVNQPNLRTLFPLDFDIRHVLKGTVDYRFKAGKEYEGPKWRLFGGKNPFFENTGANFILNARSGIPYTANSIANSLLGEIQRSQIKGSINADRLPWQFTGDMNIDKAFNLPYGEKIDGKRAKKGQFVVTLWMQNIFNTRNVVAVYPYTGSPSDDGYLASPRGQQSIAAATNAQSLVDLYNVRMANPGFYSLPRLTRLGARFIF